MLKKGIKYEKEVWIGEHKYIKPQLPKDTSEILFYNEDVENAFWLRLELPSVFYDFVPNFTELYQDATLQDDKGIFKSFNKDDSDLFINTLKQEIYRRENGVFMRIGNNIEYITGSHWFCIQHCKCYGKDTKYEKFARIFGDHIPREKFTKLYMEYGYYYQYQRDIFYLIDIVNKDDEILGLDVSKAKKTGVTFLFACYKLNKSTLYKMQQIGIMSKKQDDAIETNMMYFFHAFDGLPNIFKPNVKTDARRDGNIVFGSKTFSGTSAQKSALNSLMQDKALNSRVFTAPTKVKGFDAPKMSDVEFDEFNKMFAESHVSPREVFDTNKATVKMQDDITGKMWLFGYVSEENDAGVEEARKIYFESKLTTKRGGRRTTSELICYHVSSLNSYLSLIDKYGICDEVEANNRIEEALAKVKNEPKSYLAKKRQLARNEKEAWEVGGATSTFNVKALSDRLNDLTEDLANSGTLPYVAGYLRWENDLWEIGRKDRRPKRTFCPVKFIPLTENDILDGIEPKFLIYRKITKDRENLALKQGVDDLGNLLPPDRFDLMTGIDPTNFAAADEVVAASKNAMIAINFHDEKVNTRAGKVDTKIINAVYFHRPNNPSETYEDMLKWIIYSGSLCVVEGNASYMATELIKEGLINYMVVRNKEKALCLGKSWMKLGEDCNLIRRTANADQNDMLETLVRLISHYIEVIEGETNYLDTIQMTEIISQLIGFEPKDTRKSDLVMALGYCLLCYSVYYETLLKNNDDYNSSRSIESIFMALTS